MSVLIKDMEMPTSCRECPLEREILSRYVCAISGKLRNWGLKTRLSDCPLIPVPPHGRLIDADATMDQIEHDTPLSAVFEKTMRRYLHNAPTIIPAEEEPVKDTNVPTTYDLLYEEGGYNSNGV